MCLVRGAEIRRIGLTWCLQQFDDLSRHQVLEPEQARVNVLESPSSSPRANADSCGCICQQLYVQQPTKVCTQRLHADHVYQHRAGNFGIGVRKSRGVGSE